MPIESYADQYNCGVVKVGVDFKRDGHDHNHGLGVVRECEGSTYSRADFEPAKWRDGCFE